MKTKGSVTVFLLMILLMFFSAIFALLEAARVAGLAGQSDLYAMQGEDALMSNYNRDLWESYGVLFLECDDPGSGDRFLYLQQETIEKNTLFVQPSWFFYSPVLSETEVTSWAYATDNGGETFRSEAVRAAEREFGTDIISYIINAATGQEDAEQEGSDKNEDAVGTLEDLRNAANDKSSEINAGNEAKKAAAEEAGEDTESVTYEKSLSPAEVDAVLQDSPLEWMKEALTKGVASIVLKDEDVSEKKEDFSESVENRSLSEGNMSLDETSPFGEKVLFGLYLEKYFLNAAEEAGDTKLDYEMEYIIAGGDSDSENLASVAGRLFLVREIANLAYLETSPAKKAEALAVATAICTALLIPEFSALAQHAVLAAWAFGEAIYDARTLLSGGKIPLIKDDTTWHTSITSLAADAQGASSGGSGVTYEVYLQIFLYLQSDEQTAYRAMSLIEKNIGVRMDSMVAAAEGTDTFTASPVFSNLVTIGNGNPGMFSFKRDISISYLGGE